MKPRDAYMQNQKILRQTELDYQADSKCKTIVEVLFHETVTFDYSLGLMMALCQKLGSCGPIVDHRTLERRGYRGVAYGVNNASLGFEVADMIRNPAISVTVFCWVEVEP